MTSAARLNASLWSRIAPRTERSASRLCGSVRSATATSGIGHRRGAGKLERQREKFRTNDVMTEKLGRRHRPHARILTSELDPISIFARCSRFLVLTFAVTRTLIFVVTSRCSLTRNVVLAELLDRLVQLQLAAIDVEALRGQRLGDVARRSPSRYSASVSPTLRAISTSRRWPADRRQRLRRPSALRLPCASNFARSRSICFLLPSVTSRASLRGSR